jgi:hypothetical protein
MALFIKRGGSLFREAQTPVASAWNATSVCYICGVQTSEVRKCYEHILKRIKKIEYLLLNIANRISMYMTTITKNRTSIKILFNKFSINL